MPIELPIPFEQAAKARQILKRTLTLGGEAEQDDAQPEHGDRASGAPATPWRRVGALVLVGGLCVGGAAGAKRVPTSLEELPTDVAAVVRELRTVEDEPNPLENSMGTRESELPAGLAFEVEHAPIGPGRRNPVTYALVHTYGPRPPDEALAWLNDLPRPPATRFLLGHSYLHADRYREPPFASVRSYWRSYLVSGDPVLTADHVSQAKARPSSAGIDGGWIVDLCFNDVGAERFARYTREHVKRRFALVVDGIVMTAPVIQEEISDGCAFILVGRGPREQQRDQALQLVAGLKAAAAAR